VKRSEERKEAHERKRDGAASLGPMREEKGGISGFTLDRLRGKKGGTTLGRRKRSKKGQSGREKKKGG